MSQAEGLTKTDVKRIVDQMLEDRAIARSQDFHGSVGAFSTVSLVVVLTVATAVWFHQQARRDLGEWLLKKPAAVAEMEELRTKVDDCDDRAKYANLYLSNLNNRLKALESTKHAPNCPDGKCCPDCKCDVKPEVEK